MIIGFSKLLAPVAQWIEYSATNRVVGGSNPPRCKSMQSMLLEKFPSGPLQTNAYLIGCPKTKEAAAIDPSEGSASIILATCKKEGYTLKNIFLTHSHWDHIADVALLKKKTGAKVYVHPLDAPNLEYPGSDQLPMFYKLEGVKPDHFLEDGKMVHLGNLALKVIHTPGHSPGCVCLYLASEHLLFSGDTLFNGSMGNVSFPTSDPEKMWASLKKLQSLPGETHVLPGHGPDTILDNEKWIGIAKELFGHR